METPKEIPFETIKRLLKEEEKNRRIPDDLLFQIYEMERKVLYMGKRRNIFDDLKKAINTSVEYARLDEFLKEEDNN